MKRTRCIIQTAVLLALSVAQVGAFSLLGPYASWMTPTLGYRHLGYQQPDDIGGPMDINEAYRWNVPMVTYAFDQSFLDYFGSNGVAAVEQAIGVINDLPPASSIDLTNFPLGSNRFNPLAAAQNQYDLKSATLGLLLEQMGLADPIRYVFTLRRFDWNQFLIGNYWFLDEQTWPPGTIPEYVLERGFDPETLTTSHYVNGVLFSAYIHVFGVPFVSVDQADAVEIPVDVPISADRFTPVAEIDWFSPGLAYEGLTQDDVGGLRYLLSSNNVNFEVLLPDVHGAGTNADSFVNGALRPGIEKLTFIRQDYDSTLGRATPVTNDFTDTYFTNGMALHQQLQRVITEPDFLFSAANTGEQYPWAPMYVRTGTTNWWNSAPVTGSTNNGPGVIRPPVRITFGKNASYVSTSDTNSACGTLISWGSFDGTTNAPVAYPCATSPPQTSMRLRWHLCYYIPGVSARYMANYEWQLPLPLGGQAALQFSTNLTDWMPSAMVTNQAMAVEWFHQYGSEPSRFFRVVPQ